MLADLYSSFSVRKRVRFPPPRQNRTIFPKTCQQKHKPHISTARGTQSLRFYNVNFKIVFFQFSLRQISVINF